MSADDNEEERQRQRRERAALDPSDRLYGKRPGDLRGSRRRGRVVQMSLRMQLKVRAILEHIMQRDAHDGLPGLFEIMLKLYLENMAVSTKQICQVSTN